jgi:hypothetical protein
MKGTVVVGSGGGSSGGGDSSGGGSASGSGDDGGSVAPGATAGGSGSLPQTGLELLAVVLVGMVLTGSGTALRWVVARV